MDPARDPRRQTAHRRTPQLRAGGRGDAHGDPQAQQIEMGAVDVLAAGPPRHVGGQGLPYLGEQPQGEWMPFVGGGDGPGHKPVPLPGALRLGGGQGTDPQRGRQPVRGCRGPVQYVLRIERSGQLPVFGSAGDDHSRPAGAQPVHRPRCPVGQPVGQQRRHLLGPVEQYEQGPRCLVREPCHLRGGDEVQVVAPGARRGEDASGLPQGAREGVGDRGVVGVQVGAAQPYGGCGFRAFGAAGGERREFGRAARSRIADHAHHQGGEGVELLTASGRSTGSDQALGPPSDPVDPTDVPVSSSTAARFRSCP